MEEDKLVRMATAISRYTVSSMLQERVLAAVEAMDQAAGLIESSPWLSEQIQASLRDHQRSLAQLEHQVAEDKLTQAQEVEEAQKDLLPGRSLQCQDDSQSHPD